MRIPFLCFSLVLSLTSIAQTPKADFARYENSTEKNEISGVLAQKLQSSFGFLPSIKTDHLYVKKEFAFFIGSVSDNSGREINFTSIKQGTGQQWSSFKGQHTRALLKRRNNRWEVLTFLISPDDLSWTCWWADYSAPKEIFDFTEQCR